MLHGLTGMVQFDNEGLRTNIVLDIMELSYNGLQRIGTWNSSGSDGLRITRLLPPPSGQDSESLQNKTFIVLTALVIRPAEQDVHSADSTGDETWMK